MGLNITVLSYRDHIDLGIVADRDQIDDVWALMTGVTDALEELASVLGVKPGAGDEPAGEPETASLAQGPQPST